MSVPFVDLKTQYSHIETGIRDRIQAVLNHGRYIMGPEIEELESKLSNFCGVKHTIACSSGTDALLLGLMAYDVGPGDAVFTSTFTFFASAESIALLGATPVFVDIDPKTFNIDVDSLKLQIAKVKNEGRLNLKGVMPVNLFGLPADYQSINTLAKDEGLFVLEDTAQAFGATYDDQISGNLGDVSATSFFPAKPLGCYGDGGAVFTNDDSLAQTMRSIRVHGQGEDKYDNVRIGLNARMDTIQAAILLEKLEIFPAEVSSRQKVAQWYDDALKSHVECPFVPQNCSSTWAQYSILSDSREEIQAELNSSGIPCVIYYRVPCHLSPAFSYLGYQVGDMPVSESVSRRILSLPMHPYLEPESVTKIASVIRQFG